MDPTQIFQSAISSLILAVIVVALLAAKSLLKLGNEYLLSKLNKTEYDTLQGLALTTVRYLNQSPVWQDVANEKKKEYAIGAVVEYADQIGLPVDHALVDKIIEEAVSIVKASFVTE